MNTMKTSMCRAVQRFGITPLPLDKLPLVRAATVEVDSALMNQAGGTGLDMVVIGSKSMMSQAAPSMATYLIFGALQRGMPAASAIVSQQRMFD